MRIGVIRELVRLGRYRTRSHVVTHMIEESFSEKEVVRAVLRGRIVEEYPERERCLIAGPASGLSSGGTHLHVVCDLSRPDLVRFVTAYIPRRPWWKSPFERA